MTVKEAVVFVLMNREMFGYPVKSEKLIAHIKDLTGEDIKDAALRKLITDELCLEGGLLIGGTKEGFLIAQNREEAKAIHYWISQRIEKTLHHSRCFERIAMSKYDDFLQGDLF